MITGHHDYVLVDEVGVRILLAKVQKIFCIIAFCDKVIRQRLLPEVVVFLFFVTTNISFSIC